MRFDHIAEARAIGLMLADKLADWKIRIDDAISAGSTGSEILMALRWNMAELLKSEKRLPDPIAKRIKQYLERTSKLMEMDNGR